jgi:sigma-B regulation protein RsbU (phosphoserine phosphatase)
MQTGVINEGACVLVIEDDDLFAQLLCEQLINLGHNAHRAVSAQEGLTCFRQLNPELAIYDVHLPDDDNFTTLQQFFSLAPELAVILLAERGETEDLMRALRLGVSDYLILPLTDYGMLEHAVRNSLRRSRLLAENARMRGRLEQINAELEQRIEVFQQDQQAGRHVQINMMPTPPKTIGGFIFDHKVLPSLYLSGDTVDYKPLSRSRALFYIADVSGHGSSSAFITILLRFRIDQMRWEQLRGRFTGDFTPSTLLSRLNRELLEAGLDKHITLVMGILDSNTRKLTYSVAGHHPLPVVYGDGEATEIPLKKSSFPIGLVAEAEYFDQTIALADDFAMTLFSDGILEALPQETLAEKERYLREMVAETQGSFGLIKEALIISDVFSKKYNVPDDVAVMSVSLAL